MARRPATNPKKLDIESRITGQQKARHTSFVEVAQPGFSWYELEAPSRSTGFTSFPTGRNKKKTAAYVAPTATDTEEGRLIRVHELLHARFTPNVDRAAQLAKKAGLSNVSIQYAEDHRINTLGVKLGLFEKHNASIDDIAAKDFIVGLCRQGYGPAGPYSGGLTTGKIVQSAIALSGYPCKGFDPTDAGWIIEAAARGGYDPTERCDLDRAQAIINAFLKARAEAFARVRKGKNPDRSLLAELIRLVETTLVEAYTSEVEKEEPQPEPPKADTQPGDQSQGGEGGQGGQQESQDSQESEGGQGEGSAGEESPTGSAGAPGASEAKAGKKAKKKTEEELLEEEFADVEEKFSDIHQPGVSHNPVLNINTTSTETPQEAIRARAEKKAIEQEKARRDAAQKSDINDKFSRGTILTHDLVGSGSDGGSIVPPSASQAPSSDNLVLSLTRSEWAPMKIQLAPLSRSKKNLAPRLGRAGVDGSIPKHFSRWFSDRSILETKGRRPGGALLVDVSGSMSWSAEQTQKLVDEAPALTVALYSSGDTLNQGVLTIIARNGRVIADGFSYGAAAFTGIDPVTKRFFHKSVPNLLPHGGGNVCDGPALLWLARQPGPRVWYCDGNVSGKGDNFTLPLTIEAFRLAYLAQVTRTTDYATTLALLRGTAKPNPVNAAQYTALLEAAQRASGHITQQVESIVKATGTRDRGKDVKPKAGRK